MIKTKKADLSINMIVIVAICLIVLIIMIFLVTSRGGSLDKATECPSMGGVCVSRDANICGERINNGEGCSSNQVCCNPMTVRR